MRRDPFDVFGFAMLSIAVGALQMMLDRGQLKDWFHSTEIWIEATIAALCFYLFVVHTMTAGERSFVNRDLLKSPNFVAGSLLMFGVGLILSGTLALMPSMMQVLMNYPVFDAGWMMAPRGVGTMIAMFLVARLINKIDNRWFILVGFLLTALSLWQMTGFSLLMDSGPILFAGFFQGFRARLHLCAAEPARAVRVAASHPDPGHGDPRLDADARRQHRHRHPRNAAHPKYPDRPFAPDRRAAARQPVGTGAFSAAAVTA